MGQEGASLVFTSAEYDVVSCNLKGFPRCEEGQMTDYLR